MSTCISTKTLHDMNSTVLTTTFQIGGKLINNQIKTKLAHNENNMLKVTKL